MMTTKRNTDNRHLKRVKRLFSFSVIVAALLMPFSGTASATTPTPSATCNPGGLSGGWDGPTHWDYGTSSNNTYNHRTVTMTNLEFLNDCTNTYSAWAPTHFGDPIPTTQTIRLTYNWSPTGDIDGGYQSSITFEAECITADGLGAWTSSSSVTDLSPNTPATFTRDCNLGFTGKYRMVEYQAGRNGTAWSTWTTIPTVVSASPTPSTSASAVDCTPVIGVPTNPACPSDTGNPTTSSGACSGWNPLTYVKCALVWAFIPDSSVYTQWSTLTDNLNNKPPFSVIAGAGSFVNSYMNSGCSDGGAGGTTNYCRTASNDFDFAGSYGGNGQGQGAVTVSFNPLQNAEQYASGSNAWGNALNIARILFWGLFLFWASKFISAHFGGKPE